MAELLTRKGLDDIIHELQDIRKTMPVDAKVCRACHMVYSATSRESTCWCDYESDRSYDE